MSPGQFKAVAAKKSAQPQLFFGIGFASEKEGYMSKLSLVTTLLLMALEAFSFSACKRSPGDVIGPDVSRGRLMEKVTYTSWPPQSTPFVMIADLYDNNGVFSLNNGTRLTQGSSSDLSPDGSWLTYIYVSGIVHLMRVNTDGTQAGELYSPLAGYDIQGGRISPDGKSIVIEYMLMQGYDGIHIGVIGANGGNFRPIVADSSQSDNPTWSPDSKRIYFAWFDGTNRFGFNPSLSILAKSYIVSVNVDGSDWRFVSDTISGLSDDFMPDISPDGKYIVFTSPRAYYPQYLLQEVYIMNIDGTNVRRIVQVNFRRNGNRFDFYTNCDGTRWLKDSQHIIFQLETWTYDVSTAQNVRSVDLYIVSLDGSGLQMLTDDGQSTMLKN